MLNIEIAQKLDSNITQNDLDAYEQTIRALTNNKFHHQYIKTFNLSLNDSVVTSKNSFNGIKTGDRIEIIGTKFNNGLYTVESVSDKELTVNKELVPEINKEAFVVKIDYPADISLNIKEIIKYKAKMSNKLGVKSESISRLSTTYFDVNATDNIEGIPASFWSFLHKYRKLRW